MRSCEAADPDALGGGFAEMDAAGAAGDGKRHGLVVLAAMDAQARAGAKMKVMEEFEEASVLFEDAQNIIGASHVNLGEPEGAVLAPKIGHSAEKRDAMRAATFAAKAL